MLLPSADDTDSSMISPVMEVIGGLGKNGGEVRNLKVKLIRPTRVLLPELRGDNSHKEGKHLIIKKDCGHLLKVDLEFQG
mgnify:CR=1 FL=1